MNEELSIPAPSRAFQTHGSWGRNTAKYHWDNGRGRACCTDLALAPHGLVPPLVPAEQRCRAKGCAQRWQDAVEEGRA